MTPGFGWDRRHNHETQSKHQNGVKLHGTSISLLGYTFDITLFVSLLLALYRLTTISFYENKYNATIQPGESDPLSNS